MQTWVQNYNPLNNEALSTIVSALPVLVLFYLLAIKKIAGHWAAISGLVTAVLVALLVFRMPPTMVLGATAHGAVYAAFWIAWVVVGAVFVYDLTVESGHFETIKGSIGGLTDDRRLRAVDSLTRPTANPQNPASSWGKSLRNSLNTDRSPPHFHCSASRRAHDGTPNPLRRPNSAPYPTKST
ncbi:L-lactate permease [Paludibaculum fermentans]|uniref:L-lactate permease n=1 Tax=Paludibaculum fermentans TaxID=1473598 RepID=A0A7S7NX27_PALFE|nr:L-lactate permease [Paludibaculum fermentans]QOY91365.1 L-lactate permease [Paludibaculum fermentans]